MKTEIWITTKREGFHSWPDAPDQVSFLRTKHRHLFHFKVGFPVYHNDRDLEFFIQLKKVNDTLDKYNMQDTGSCETLCQYLLHTLPQARWVEVSEDGENGARMDR